MTTTANPFENSNGDDLFASALAVVAVSVLLAVAHSMIVLAGL